MFAVYATRAAPNDPLAALAIGEQPEPTVPEGWLRVKISHASLNRHDLFTLRGWPQPAATGGKPAPKSVRVDIGAKMRGMWK